MHMVAQSESSICVTVEDNIFSHRSFLSISFICDFCFVFVVDRIKAAGKDTYTYVCYTHICIEFTAASLMPLCGRLSHTYKRECARVGASPTHKTSNGEYATANMCTHVLLLYFFSPIFFFFVFSAQKNVRSHIGSAMVACNASFTVLIHCYEIPRNSCMPGYLRLSAHRQY